MPRPLLLQAPRSGRDLVGGVSFLGRTIDKTRAHIAGTAGEYIALRGLSNRVFETFNDIIDAACDAWNKLIATPDAITSIGTRQWAHVGQL